MPLEAPNFFDPKDFERMRTKSRPYDPNIDYSRIIAQLKESCKKFGYLAIAPQNLVEPAVLESVIVLPYYNKPLRALVDPRIVWNGGGRIQHEGCANIRLVHNKKKFAVVIKTFRPRRLVVAHRVDGEFTTSTYDDYRPQDSVRISGSALICHEIHHTQGILITDWARKRLLRMRRIYQKEYKTLQTVLERLHLTLDYNLIHAPMALVRDGDKYVLRLASEWEDGAIPQVSPDVVYLDYFYKRVREISRMYVPRGGELLPIVPSDLFKSYYFGF